LRASTPREEPSYELQWARVDRKITPGKRVTAGMASLTPVEYVDDPIMVRQLRGELSAMTTVIADGASAASR